MRGRGQLHLVPILAVVSHALLQLSDGKKCCSVRQSFGMAEPQFDQVWYSYSSASCTISATYDEPVPGKGRWGFSYRVGPSCWYVNIT